MCYTLYNCENYNAIMQYLSKFSCYNRNLLVEFIDKERRIGKIEVIYKFNGLYARTRNENRSLLTRNSISNFAYVCSAITKSRGMYAIKSCVECEDRSRV